MFTAPVEPLNMYVCVIGIDCATEDSKIGLALGQLTERNIRVAQPQPCSRKHKAIDMLVQCLMVSDADRIARTAHRALALLGDLRKQLRQAIPLAWNSDINQLINCVQ
jgi:hypothetical protein